MCTFYGPAVSALFPRLASIVAFVLSALILGTFGVLIRFLSPAFSDAGQVLFRSVGALLIIGFIIIVIRLNLRALLVASRRALLFFSICFPLSLLFFTSAVNLTSASVSLCLLYAGGILTTTVIGRYVFNEQVSTEKIGAILLVLSGMMMILHGVDLTTSWVGLGYGLLAGVTEGAANAARKGLAKTRVEVVVFYQCLSGLLIAGIIAFSSSEPIIRDLGARELGITAVFSILLVVIGYLLSFGFKHAPVSLGTILLSTELGFAIVINALALQEYPSNYQLFGASLIFLSAILVAGGHPVPRRDSGDLVG